VYSLVNWIHVTRFDLSWPFKSSFIVLGVFRSYIKAFPPLSEPTAIVWPSEQNEMQLSWSPVIIYFTSLHSTMSKKCIFSSNPTEHISRLFTGLNAIPVQDALCAKNFCLRTLLWRSHNATTPLSNDVAKVR
jgi:hypothetical protein